MNTSAVVSCLRWIKRGRLLWVKAAKNVFIADKETEAAGAVFKWVVPYTSCLNMKE